MVKIITYRERIDETVFSREEPIENSKKSKKIYAEEELEQLLNEGWNIVFASTSEPNTTNILMSATKLIVILRK